MTTTLKVTKKKTATVKTVSKTEAPVEPVVEPVPIKVAPKITPVEIQPPEIIVDNGVVQTQIKRKKEIATREKVLQSFDDICKSINEQITNSKEDKNVDGKALKFLRNINKNLGSLKKDTGKLIRHKRKSVTTDDTVEDSGKETTKMTSGFLKPVPISLAMAKFTGWAPNELKSRVDVTKFLCNYIKDNNLQNPTDRRQIVADKKLSQLLEYKEGSNPLTYFDMQSHLKKHFPKTVIKA
jgi:chromatin remodeling complex protein RSC6